MKAAAAAAFGLVSTATTVILACPRQRRRWGLLEGARRQCPLLLANGGPRDKEQRDELPRCARPGRGHSDRLRTARRYHAPSGRPLRAKSLGRDGRGARQLKGWGDIWPSITRLATGALVLKWYPSIRQLKKTHATRWRPPAARRTAATNTVTAASRTPRAARTESILSDVDSGGNSASSGPRGAHCTTRNNAMYARARVVKVTAVQHFLVRRVAKTTTDKYLLSSSTVAEKTTQECLCYVCVSAIHTYERRL